MTISFRARVRETACSLHAPEEDTERRDSVETVIGVGRGDCSPTVIAAGSPRLPG
ncbi:hypothetical protein [Halorussus ruber]|uniref:hypothetical protein n=1 Tax=Halorussus ruber TaxID=1126238 RepID=UPI00143CFBE9|nr:hypothetical protein [Halorussus ruber]